MPWLDAGDVDRVPSSTAEHNVAGARARRCEAGKHDRRAPADVRVRAEERGARDFLGTDGRATRRRGHLRRRRSTSIARHREAPFDTDFDGTTYEKIMWQAACHLRAQQIGPESARPHGAHRRQGADGRAVLGASTAPGGCGPRTSSSAKRVRQAADGHGHAQSEADLVAGDCHLANTAIDEDTGKVPSHPIQVLARAYGIEDGVTCVSSPSTTSPTCARTRSERDELPRAHHRLEEAPPRRSSATSSPSCSRTPTRCAGRSQEMARAERMLTDDAIADEVATYNELDPRHGRAVGHAVHRAHRRRAAPRMAAEARRHPARSALRSRRRRRTSSVAAAHATRNGSVTRRHHLDRPLPARSLSHAAQQRAVRGRPGPHRGRPPRVPGSVELTDEQRAELAATSRTDARADPRSRGLDPELPLPRQQHTDDAGFDLHAREDVDARARRRTRARAHRPRDRDSRRVTPASCCHARGSPSKHGITCLNTPGLIDPLYRGELKVLLVNTDPADAVHREPRATASRSS